MKVAIGFKAHSGWAAAVAVGLQDEHPHLVDRQRLALVDTGDAAWARQPYHAAEGLTPSRADALVQRGIAAARETSAVCVDRWVQQLRDAGHDIAGGTVLTAPPMPAAQHTSAPAASRGTSHSKTLATSSVTRSTPRTARSTDAIRATSSR